jgi:hypothetical protein
MLVSEAGLDFSRQPGDVVDVPEAWVAEWEAIGKAVRVADQPAAGEGEAPKPKRGRPRKADQVKADPPAPQEASQEEAQGAPEPEEAQEEGDETGAPVGTHSEAEGE